MLDFWLKIEYNRYIVKNGWKRSFFLFLINKKALHEAKKHPRGICLKNKTFCGVKKYGWTKMQMSKMCGKRHWGSKVRGNRNVIPDCPNASNDPYNFFQYGTILKTLFKGETKNSVVWSFLILWTVGIFSTFGVNYCIFIFPFFML